ncbi:TPA: hypothetical protein ACKRRP_005821, partial [Pseudomonas aeruginosa]
AGFGYLQTANFAFSLLFTGISGLPAGNAPATTCPNPDRIGRPQKAQTRLESTPSRSGSMAVAGEPGIRWSVFPVVLRVLP